MTIAIDVVFWYKSGTQVWRDKTTQVVSTLGLLSPGGDRLCSLSHPRGVWTGIIGLGSRSWPTFSVKGQIVNILGFVSHMVSVTTIHAFCLIYSFLCYIEFSSNVLEPYNPIFIVLLVNLNF